MEPAGMPEGDAEGGRGAQHRADVDRTPAATPAALKTASTDRVLASDDIELRKLAVTVALAELQALRNEMVSRTSIQTTLVGLGFTVTGVIVGFVVKENGDKRLLLALPLVALVVNLLWSIESRRQSLSGTYIQLLLWPELKKLAAVEFDTWEEDVDTRRRWPYFLASLITDGVLLGLFTIAGGAGLVVAAAKKPPSDALLAGGWVCVAVSILFPAGLAAATQLGRKTKKDGIKDKEAKASQMAAGASGGGKGDGDGDGAARGQADSSGGPPGDREQVVQPAPAPTPPGDLPPETRRT